MASENSSKILIVDDVPVNLQLLSLTLAKEYELFVATSGKEALEVAARVRPDLVLLDIMMPEMDGYQVCRAFRENPELASIPVIFVTALHEEINEIQGLTLGAVDYLVKPFTAAIVRLRIRNQLELKLSRDTLKRRTEQLEAALERVKALEGILPICMYCKRIREDSDEWSQLEGYISRHSEATFSHGICPECYKKHCSHF